MQQAGVPPGERPDMPERIAPILLAVSLLLPGCTLPDTRRSVTVVPPYYSSLQSDEIQREVERLKEIASTTTDVYLRAESHLKLALLHSDHRNPNADFAKSLDELERYVSFARERGMSTGVENWYFLLKEIERLRNMSTAKVKEKEEIKKKLSVLSEKDKKLEARIRRLSKERKKMEKTIAELEKENGEMGKMLEKQALEIRKMKETIERLKSLDLRLEKERGRIR